MVSTGILGIRVTDAPPEYEVSAINVTVAHIEVHKAGDKRKASSIAYRQHNLGTEGRLFWYNLGRPFLIQLPHHV